MHYGYILICFMHKLNWYKKGRMSNYARKVMPLQRERKRERENIRTQEILIDVGGVQCLFSVLVPSINFFRLCFVASGPYFRRTIYEYANSSNM